MGGKKRTKWRKLPLEEFTKEIPPKTDKVPPRDTCQPDLTKEENNYLPSDNEPSEPAQNYTESYEYIDGLWYPTSCVVYNPAEVGLYSNYMMPMDNCYYYYPVPEVPQMQEYVPMPYQEYPPALPKDTVYLLLPTQSLRPTQPVQNIVPEWQGRRRRRRYEGYADYAIIPDKPNATKVDDKYSCKTTGPRLNSRRNSYQSNNCRKMSSFTEPATLDSFNNFSEQKPSCSKSNDMSMTDMNNLKGPTKEMDFPSNKENVGINLKYKNNLERCGTLSGNPEKNEQTATEKIKSNFISSKKEVNPVADLHAIDKADKEKPSSITGDIPISSVNNKQVCNSLNLPAVISNNLTPQNSTKEQSDKMHTATVPKNEKSEPISSLNYTEKEINSKTKITAQKQIVDSAITKVERNLMSEDNTKSNSQSSQPDILSAFNKSLSNEEIKKLDTSSENPSPYSADLNKELYPKSKPLLSQTSYFPNLLSSEAIHKEIVIQPRQLQSHHSFQENLYKLTVNENDTDQSEADSRSPSPVTPESYIPSSLPNYEINVHEADSEAEPEPEDVEMITHRYESESFLNQNKNVYVNKLSLAVELLRTREPLPYDKEFKRIVGSNDELDEIVPGVHTRKKVNSSCMKNSFYLNTFDNIKPLENEDESRKTNSENSNNGLATLGGSLEALIQPEKDIAPETRDIQDNPELVRAGFRRFGFQVYQHFSPRKSTSLNPCDCCIIM